MIALKNQNEAIIPFITTLYNEQKQRLSISHEKNKKVDEEFLKTFNDLCKTYLYKQKEGIKAPAAAICIYYLKSSILTGSFEFQINIYDKQMYFEKDEVVTYWVPILEKGAFEENMKVINTYARENIFHFGNVQIHEIRMKYASMYFFLIGKYLKSLINEMLEQPFFLDMEKEEDFIITYGAYMDKLLPIYRMKESLM